MHHDAASPAGEKLAVARLQREVARSKSEGTMREKLIHELEEERRLRLESEKRLREVTEESELGRAQMVSLQQQFSRMEETVRSLLQNQGGVLEQTAVDTVDIMKAYKDKLSEEVQKPPDEPVENQVRLPEAEPDGGQEDRTKPLLERLKALEEENSALASENEIQREQYERCLDEVANQVVQALLTQKDLREECVKLRTRVFDLEQQNRALSVLFQQRIKPASDLLLQKLHSRIMDLSAADLLLEPERSKAFLLSRNTDSPPTEVQLPGKPGVPVAKCLSQLSLSAPLPVYPRSSCSSSEISLSSACSEFSSGSYTWNDGRSAGKTSSLTWEKRLSLGSSAPSNICAPSEEQRPTRCKESHILEGLRKLQRRKHRSSSCSSKVSRSGYKDCMNSNEGIYSLGIKTSSKGVSKPSRSSAARGKQFFYDSDDADDELVRSGRGDNIPTKDCWFHCKRLSHSISDSLCSWEGTQESGTGSDVTSGLMVANPCSGCDSKEPPEKLVSFIHNFLSHGEHKSAFSKPSKLHFSPPDPDGTKRLCDVDKSGCSEVRMSCDQPTQEAKREFKRLSRDAAKLLKQKYLGKDQGRTQSADERPRPFSLMKEPKASKCTQSEESILAIFDAEGEPIELCPQRLGPDADETHSSKNNVSYAELVPQERPTRQLSTHARNYNVLESPEKPSECQTRTGKPGSSREGSTERLSLQLTPQRKLIKPPSIRASKGQSIPPLNDAACSKSSGSKIPGRNKPSASPLRASNGSTTEPSISGHSGSSTQEKSPSSPTVKMSRFIKTQTSSQSPKAVNSKLSSRAEWSKAPSSTSPHLPRRLLDFGDTSEQPTRDKHCEPSKNKLRSPSPPPPPGRSTSLLIRPNYEGSPQAHKTGVAQPSTLTTGRGPPPSYYTSLAPNMQTTLPIKDKECLDLDAGYGTALAPQKLAEKPSQHLQKSPAVAQTPTKGTSKRTKDYLPSGNSGCAREPENAPRSSKNVPPPYSALRGSSLQNSFAIKKGPTHDGVHQTVQKTSISLPISLQSSSHCQTEQQSGKAIVSPPASAVVSLNQAEKASKTRIPMGFKAFLKSPPASKSSPTVPGKQEKDHINSVSKETVTTNVSTQCDGLQSAYSIDVPPQMSSTEGKGEAQEVYAAVLPEEGDGNDKGKRNSQLFGRSISVTTKAHLKPALGMNGAKARSQSFSTNYMEKPNVGVLEGPGKVRTQIITNSGERGNSLSRQSSLEVPSVGLAESPVHSPRMRLSHYGGMTASASTNGQNPDKTSKSSAKGEGVTSPTHKEVHSQPASEHTGFSNVYKSKGASSPQFLPQPSFFGSEREKESLVTSSNEPVQTQLDSPIKPADTEEKKISPTVCTIEEKVMMGIEENLQKSQEQEKVAASEAKQKNGPSLANWFGLRKSKLPALSGKKSDSPKGKEEKKDLKIGSVLVGKQIKPEKKKDRKKESQEGQNLSEMNNKLSSIMDHCNNQMGQIASQIHCTTAFIGKDQFVKDLLGRTAVKVGSVAASPAATSTPRKHGEICPDTATLLITQKISLKAGAEEEHHPDSTCQDHMIGSGCQMRTLDSGIGTFPLPDSVTRAGGRHVPKSESSPGVGTAGAADPVATEPDGSAPAGSMAHSASEPAVSGSRNAQSRLPKLSSSDAIRTKRRSFIVQRSNMSASIEDQQRKRKTTELQSVDFQQTLLNLGCSSDSDGSALASPQRPKRPDSVEHSADALRTQSEDKAVSIMDFYQNEMFSHVETDGGRISQYELDGMKAGQRISKELSAEKLPVGPSRPACLDISLESLNKLNHGTPGSPPGDGSLGELRGEGHGDAGPREPIPASGLASRPGADTAGSLSDSLYDSFSSCTSQASNGV